MPALNYLQKIAKNGKVRPSFEELNADIGIQDKQERHKTHVGKALEIGGIAGAGLTAGLFAHMGGARALDTNADPKILVYGGPKEFTAEPKAMDSFSAQSHAMVRGLRDMQMDVEHLNWPEGVHDIVTIAKRKTLATLAARKHDAIIFTGHGHAYPKHIGTLGKVRYRQGTDFGEGNAINDKNIYMKGLAGQDAMAVRENPKWYRRVFGLGHEGTEIRKKFQGKDPTVMLGNIPVSQVFSDTHFAEKNWATHLADGVTPVRKKAFITFGGGNAAPITFDELGDDLAKLKRTHSRRDIKAPGFGRRYDISKRFWLDDLVQSLNAKHGEGVDINLLIGGKKNPDTGLYTQPGQWGNIPEFYDYFENYLKTPEGQARFPGLKLIERLPHAPSKLGEPSMAGHFADSHYNFVMPGSTSAELLAMQGDNNGKTILLMPKTRVRGFMKHWPNNAAEMEHNDLPNVHRWNIHDKVNRRAQLEGILGSELKSGPGRKGYTTDYARLKGIIEHDVKKQKVKNIKTLVAMGGISMGTTVFGKIMDMIESRRNKHISAENAAAHPAGQIKEASTRLVREALSRLKAGVPAHKLFSKAEVAAELAAYKSPHERFITRLGTGHSNHADLVFHPKFGPVVRRSPRHPTENLHYAPDTRSRLALMKWQKKHKDSGFAKIYDVEPSGISYSEVIENTHTKKVTKIMERIKELQAEHKGVIAGKKRGITPAQAEAIKAKITKRIEQAEFNLHGETHKRQKLKPGTIKTVNYLKQYNPELYDFNGRHNNMAGRIVDYSTVHDKTKGSYTKSKDPNRDVHQIFRDRAAGKYTLPVQMPDKVPGWKKPFLVGAGATAGALGLGYAGYKYKHRNDGIEEPEQIKQASALSRHYQRRLASGVSVKDLVSKVDAKRLKDLNMPGGPRSIKYLGSGKNSDATLVAHPQHGVVVRKSPTKPTEDLHKATDTKALVLLKKIQDNLGKKKSGFARIHGVDNSGMSYWEYVEPKKNKHWDKLKAHRDASKAELANFQTLLEKDPTNAELIKAVRKATAKASIHSEAAQNYGYAKVPISSATKRTAAKMKKTFPNLWDYSNHNNYIDGRAIDFNTHGGGYTKSKNPLRDKYEIFREARAGKFTEPVGMPKKQRPNDDPLTYLAAGGGALALGTAGYMGYKALKPDMDETANQGLAKVSTANDALIREFVNKQHNTDLGRRAFSTQHINLNDDSKENIDALYNRLPNKGTKKYVAKRAIGGGAGWGIAGLAGHSIAKGFGAVSPKSSPWPYAIGTGALGAWAHGEMAKKNTEGFETLDTKQKKELIKRYIQRNASYDDSSVGRVAKETNTAAKMAIPMMVGTSLLSAGAGLGAIVGVDKLDELSDKHMDELLFASKQYDKVHMVKPTRHKSNFILNENAGYIPKETVRMLRKNKAIGSKAKRKLLGEAKDNKPRVIASSRRMWKPGIVAHELGHASLQADKHSVAGWLQRNAYKPTRIANMFGGGLIPTTATYLATKDDDSVLSGTAKGLAIGAGANAGVLIPEAAATHRGIRSLIKTTLPKEQKVRNAKSMLLPFLTYALAGAGPSAAVGGIRAYLNKRKKQHALKEQAELNNPHQ